jgi:type II secretory pathway pseudopilin PulG
MLKEKGQSLLEMVIIIGVVGIALVAVTLASTISIRNSRVAKERSVARNYALEIFEQLKAEKTADPDTFLSQGSGTDTLAPVGENPEYTRTVEYNPVIPGEKMEITVTIGWVDSGRNLSIVEQTTLEKYAQ